MTNYGHNNGEDGKVKFVISNRFDDSSSDAGECTDGSKLVETTRDTPRNHYFIMWQETLKKAQTYINGTEMVSYLIRFGIWIKHIEPIEVMGDDREVSIVPHHLKLLTRHCLRHLGLSRIRTYREMKT